MEELVPSPRLLLGRDSPFRRLPANLDPRQAAGLDGIRFTVDMLCAAFWRLSDTLLRASQQRGDEGHPPWLFTLAFLDAWSVVDAAFRLHGLIEGTPGMKGTPDRRALLDKLAPVEALRHGVQHLRGQVSLADGSSPIWGSLTWLYCPDPPSPNATACVMVPGSLKSMEKLPAINPGGRGVQVPVGLIELTAFGATVSLSRLFDTVADFVQHFERALEKTFGDHPHAGSDLLVYIDIEFPDAPRPAHLNSS